MRIVDWASVLGAQNTRDLTRLSSASGAVRVKEDGAELDGRRKEEKMGIMMKGVKEH